MKALTAVGLLVSLAVVGTPTAASAHKDCVTHDELRSVQRGMTEQEVYRNLGVYGKRDFHHVFKDGSKEVDRLYPECAEFTGEYPPPAEVDFEAKAHHELREFHKIWAQQ